MPLHSLWNNSGRVYDRCAFARISAWIVLDDSYASRGLKPRADFEDQAMDALVRIRRSIANTAPIFKNRAVRPAPEQFALTQCPPVFGLPTLFVCRCSASALAFCTFKVPGADFAPSSTSTQLPPIWLPVAGGTQTMCFPFFWPALACAAGTGLRSKFNCVIWSGLVFVFVIDVFTAPFTTNVTW